MNLQEFNAQIMAEIPNYKPNRPELFNMFWSHHFYGNDTYNNANSLYFKWLSLAVKKIQPKNIVELGNDMGASTLCIYAEMPTDAHFITIDLLKKLECLPYEVLNDPRMRYLFGNDVDPEIFKGVYPKNIDFLFIDADHTDVHVSKELNLYLPFCKKGCLIAFDDARSIQNTWNNLTLNKLSIPECHSIHNTGFAIAEV